MLPAACGVKFAGCPRHKDAVKRIWRQGGTRSTFSAFIRVPVSGRLETWQVMRNQKRIRRRFSGGGSEIEGAAFFVQGGDEAADLGGVQVFVLPA
jgi:hypothetical protein